MITAIMFGSAARRCSGENIITRYQMTVLVEAICAETPSFEDSRRGFSCGVRELKWRLDNEEFFIQIATECGRDVGGVLGQQSG